MEETATSYMPINVDLKKLMPEDFPQAPEESVIADAGAQERRSPSKNERRERLATKGQATAVGGATKRKRISLYLDDNVLTKIFRVSLERHEQLSSATHRLILEALKARGL
ncbi:hypothetical protein [Rhizobium sp. 007]|uniref:hypothetical protein n=1 Tax=Rhizobium sp. 007 TaxID=2785056 RepID=UPI001FEFFA6A|nr:hypothetical protein [Rhizobium sp. 007]